tara:strand:+ start:1962 stop:2267 length:306 start_codon:yes stop_codon:yes gene_type:complete
VKIKIAETIDTTELSTRLQQMMEVIKGHVVDGLSLCDPVTAVITSASDTGENLAMANKNVALLRQNLYDIDVKLEDIQMILSGYDKIINTDSTDTKEESDS